MAHCMRHYEEPVDGVCRTCGRNFCSRCLVYAFGAKKPPYCVGCALGASGIRNGVRTPPPPAQVEEPDAGAVPARRSLRAQRRAEKREEKANLKALMRGDQAVATAETEARDSTVPVPKRLLTPASRFASRASHEPS